VKNRTVPFIFLILTLFPCPSYAAPTPLEISDQEEEKSEISPEKTWFKSFNDSRENFAEKYGTRFAFLFNYTQQTILDSSNDLGKSQGVGYWNFEVAQRLWKGGELFSEFEMDRGRGVDKFLPTFSVFNENSGNDANLYIPALYIEQKIIGDKLFLAAGKLDLSYWFDCNDVANSADTQFFSSALVNSLTLPFPSKGIGAMASFKPYEWMYFQAGAATARANYTKTGLSDAFNSAFFINELGLSPKLFGALKGNYRFIFNINHEKLDFINSDETKTNSLSWALSFDQAVAENITLFLRYGFADQKVRDIEYFWSCGGQITEPIPGRKQDILAAGVAQSIVGGDYREANGEDTARSETIYEVYYSYNLNPAVSLTPNIQIVAHPNADKTADTEVVCGLRFLLSF